MKVELIIEIVLLFIALYLAFFKSYLTEKGKSAALKEDLEDLTREIESVKNEFVKEQEMMKTDLQRILDNEISYRSEERDAIIKYHGIVNQWLYSILEVSLSNYDKTNISELIKIRNSNSSFYAKTGIAKSKILLLVEDSALIKSANDLFLHVMHFHYWADEVFLKYQHNCEKQKSLTDRFIIVIKNYEENEELAKAMAIDEQNLKAEQKKIYEEYIKTDRNLELEKTQPFKSDFETLAKEYLKN
tara:strand:+ start:1569 stop:2303 length:735 start_codon:yes stop_codon:yes gene_type:complete